MSSGLVTFIYMSLMLVLLYLIIFKDKQLIKFLKGTHKFMKVSRLQKVVKKFL
tara:strand:+ start:708 stop:866 length:159 start_codon:yes stop_codon:yes gene_type:complete